MNTLLIQNKLFTLATSLILGEGEYLMLGKNPIIYSEVSMDKIKYLKAYTVTNYLQDFIDLKQNSVTIEYEDVVKCTYNTFYKNGTKIFSSRLDPSKISFQSILLWVNLFGKRNEDYISVPTTITSSYMRILMYCLEKHLNVPILLGPKQVKILDIKELYSKIIHQSSISDGAEFANFLSRKEYNEMINLPQQKNSRVLRKRG